MLLILTQPLDAHADRVQEDLRRRGAPVVRLDTAEFPAQAEVSLAYDARGRARYTLRRGADEVDLRDVTAVWDRRPRDPVPPAAIADGPARDYLVAACRTFLQDTWNALPCLWVPARRPVVMRAQLKASQLALAGALGFTLPPTLVSNSPADVLDFYRRHEGRIVSKVVGFPAVEADGTTFGRYTEAVAPRDVGYAPAIRACPMIFQAYVPKQVEVRVTVVGTEVFAAEIHSQATNRTRVDWRRYDHFGTPYRWHDLPPALARRCRRLVQRLGLHFGAVDLALTPDGRYVFFEINPNGQYLWIEHATGLPISAAVGDLLLSGPHRAGIRSPGAGAAPAFPAA